MSDRRPVLRLQGAAASPLADFLSAAEAAGLRTDIHVVARGDTHRFTRSGR